MLSLEKTQLPVKHNRRKRESSIRTPETQSGFHPRAQRNAFVVAMRVGNEDRSPAKIHA
jgi:hypothetical protein